VTAGNATFIFIVTGEPSGDALGGALIAALRRRTGGRLRVAGIGGERMREQGLESLVPLGDLAIMGVAEVLPRAPVILRGEVAHEEGKTRFSIRQRQVQGIL